MLERLIGEIPRFFSWQNLVLLGEAMGITLAMTLIGCVLGFFFAFAIAFTRQFRGIPVLPLRIAAILFVETFRRIPFLVVLFLVLFSIQAVHSGTSLFSVAVVSICIYSTAYIADIIRGGFESVPRPQIEAAFAMNFSRWQVLKSIIIPQSWPVVVPPAIVFMVGFIKDTSLVSQIGVFELTFRARELNNMGFSGILVFSTIAFLYFAISYPLTRWGQWLEKHLATRRRASS